MADLTHRNATAPLRQDDDGWTGPCLAERCKGTRHADAWGTLDGRQPHVLTICGTCGRTELEPAPGMEQDPLPGLEGT